VRADNDFAILVAASLHQNQPFSIVISGILLRSIFITDVSKQKIAIAKWVNWTTYSEK
jgi:hypothetical protein